MPMPKPWKRSKGSRSIKWQLLSHSKMVTSLSTEMLIKLTCIWPRVVQSILSSSKLLLLKREPNYTTIKQKFTI